MGDPRKQRRKYSGPRHPWNRARIDEEKVYVEEYGLKNKKDLWKMTSTLAQYKKQAKSLITRRDAQGETEKQLFLEKLQRLRLIGEGATVDDVLSLSVKDLLERRLQTFLYRKGLSRSVKQARQFIVHGHVFVSGQKMNAPSYLVPIRFEESISFSPRSALVDPDHPERRPLEKVPVLVEEQSSEEKVSEETPVEKTAEKAS